jgi:hypothetical protein
MKQGKKSILILSLILFFGTLPGIICAEWDNYNDESWQSVESGRYNTESWQSVKSGRYNTDSWQSLKSGTYLNDSWQALKSGTYKNNSWQAKDAGRYNNKSWDSLTPGTYIHEPWRMKEIPCSKCNIKPIRPRATSVGNTMAIRGNGFGGDPGEVLFNKDVPAKIVSWSNRYIEVLVPEGATTGEVKIVKTCPSGTFGVSQQIAIETPLSE